MPTSPADSDNNHILIVAAEASSCPYAKLFIDRWQSQVGNWSFFGIGDREMAANGMSCQGYAEDLAVVGLQEVLAHWPEIKKTYYDILEQVRIKKPRFALLLDYPGFNVRLAKDLKKLGVPVVYYISPQLWAWKRGRIKQIRQYVDDMLVVFPFEVDFYKNYGVEARFVGHPLLEVVEQEKQGLGEQNSNSMTLGLMPGSRKSEIKYNLLTQLQTADILKKQFPQLQVKLLAAPTLDQAWLKGQMGELGKDIEILQESPTQMISQCQLILSASGTATLQVALLKKPMVVMYRMNAITAWIAKRLVNTVDFFCIVNLIAGKEVVTEHFQQDANPQKLSQDLARIIEDPDHRQQVIGQLETVVDKLGGGGATQNVVNFLQQKYVES